MKKNLFLLLSAAIMSMFFADNVAIASAVNTLIIPTPTDVSNLNRMFEPYKEGHLILNPLYDELFYKDVNETRYYLAESCEVSEDGLTVILKLKDNIKWHDGEAITADDVIFTMNVCALPENGASFANVVRVNNELLQYRKIDDLTVEIKLPTISASYVALLGKLILIPEHLYDGQVSIKSSEKNLIGIGSGPFKVREWRRGQYLALEKFDNYYGGKASLDGVIFRVIPNANAQEISLKNGETSLIEINTVESYNKYSSDQAFKVYAFPEGRVNYMACNMFSDTFKDSKVKQAIFAALNAEEIVMGAYGSKQIASVANSLFSPKSYYQDTDIEGYKQDLPLAQRLIDETGLKGKTLKLIFNANRAYQQETALIIQQQLKNLGVNLEITPLESNGFFAKAFSDAADYDLYLNGYAATGDPDVFVGMFNGTWGINVYVSEKAKALWAEGSVTVAENKRAAIYKQLQAQAKEDMTIYPIAFPNYCFVARSNVNGLDALSTIPVFEDYLKISFEK